MPADAEEQRRLRRACRHMYVEPMPVLSARAQQAAAATQYDQVVASTLCVTCCMQSKCWLGVPLLLSTAVRLVYNDAPCQPKNTFQTQFL